MKTEATSRGIEARRRRRPWASARVGVALRAASHTALLLVALWAPLPLGSARPWAWGLLAALTGLLILMMGLSDLLVENDEALPLRIIGVPTLLFEATILWAVFQSLPWAPTAWQNPLWHDAAALLPGHPLRPSISIDPTASRTVILRLLTYAGIFWLAFRCCQHAHKARLLMTAIAGIGTAYSAWGLAVYWNGNHSVLWYDKWAYWGDLTSTFVNRNSYATYAGLTVVTAIALFLDNILRGVDFQQPPRVILRSLIEVLMTRSAWFVGCVAISATALLLTHSRGGMTATGVGVLTLLVMICLAPSLRGPWRAAFGISVLVGAAAVLFVSGAATFARVAETSMDLEARPEIFQLTLAALADHPLLGTGLGTFQTVFEAYRTPDLPFFVNAAHNDYLENMLELGIPAAVLLFGSLAALLAMCVRGAIRRRRDAILPCIGVGATALVAMHSLVDFSLQIPAVTATYLMLLGAAVAQSIPSGTRVQSDDTAA